ncbi:VapC toxin family PIN domain ribonuclease [Streptomyces sp. NPDC005374]|uniref:VapC toxin family PIN domain ribonuclease n=1 Tax=Streptomyces sp. NPDC005374 TaxID=3364713 RepID=UPI0036BA460C
MITYLLDTSALWHLFRTPGALPPRATSPSHRDELAEELDALCHLSPVPKNAWRWVDTAQYKLTQQGQHRAAGAIDLLVCATAVHHGHTVLHVDNDFATVAGVLKEVQQRDVRA